ncbi:putative Dynein binding protein [Spironucleus salmonicida]|uniref:Outer dynein arm-docking complex subunit 4 n=1 Tax=Spironucleus salmonicida TaxID=348837 RepID=V6LS99_9EUKA|nr:putative Dynein binding protein [Spironucleus salmonicida]|eukprot:EST47537.1 hypothetical protein SS50377_12521 [Spironucleus salmonicida]
MAESNGKFHILIAEGDTCFRNQLYQKAVNAYTEAIDIQPDREVLLQRSRCYVQLGLSDLAIQDASTAISSDNSFYRGFYQKGEAFYSAGQFEQALVFYYRAYRRRPDIQDFRLGVQKAEESILRALDACVGDEQLIQFVGKTNITTRQVAENLANDNWPENFAPQDAHRCLCGCQWCNCERCTDLYQTCEKGQMCTCLCEACIRHNAQTQGVLPNPITGEPEKIGAILGDVSVTNTATPATAYLEKNITAMNAGFSSTSMTKQDDAEQPKKKGYKKGLDKDKEFLMELACDDKLKRCQQVPDILKEGIDFIDKRSEFWRSQGNNASKKNSAQRLKSPPNKLSNSNIKTTRVVDFSLIIQNLQEAQLYIQDKNYSSAEETIGKLDVQLQNLTVQFNDDALLKEKAKILSDVETMAGCMYFDQNKLDQSISRFQRAKNASLDAGESNLIRGTRNLFKSLVAAQQFDEAVDIYLQLSSYFPKMPRYLVSQDSYDVIKQNKLTGETLLEAAFQALDGVTHSGFEFEKGIKIVENQKGVQEFENKAPSWFGEEKYVPVNDIAFECLRVIAKEYDSQFQKPRAEIAWKELIRIGKECEKEEIVKIGEEGLKASQEE